MKEIQYYENILELVGNTPLVSLKKITENLPGKFLAKVEAFNPGHSAKDRTALYMKLKKEETLSQEALSWKLPPEIQVLAWL